jgi:hypothetical protein
MANSTVAPSAANPTGVIALADLPEHCSAGELTYLSIWGPIDMQQLSSAWEEAGLDPALLPNPPTPENALKRALLSTKKKHQLLRPLPKSEKGYALIDESATDDNDRPLDYDTDHTITARVIYDSSDGENAVTTVKVTPADAPHADEIKRLFHENFNFLIGWQIGNWVWKTLGSEVRTVRLRKDGGFCYVPPEYVEQWDAYRAVIGGMSEVKLYGIPAMRSEGAVEAILDGVAAEARKCVEDWQEELQQTGDDALGATALRTRETRSGKLREKVAYYETLCSRALPELQKQIDELDADIASALLLADEEEDS